jgi:hypothetical protein
VAGSFFSKLLRPELHFCRSRPLPGSWDYVFGIDWGSSSPACLLVAAVDNDGCLWIIDELHQPGITGSIFGEAMNEKWRHQKWSSDRIFKNDSFWGVIDKQAMDQHNGPATAAAGIQEWGFRIFEAQKERIPGCNQLKERLLLNRMGKPQLKIFEDRCPQLVKALSGIPSNAPKTPDEYNPDSPHAHAVDALRFIAMAHPTQPARPENPIDAEVARWDRLLRRQRTSKPHAGAPGYGD